MVYSGYLAIWARKDSIAMEMHMNRVINLPTKIPVNAHAPLVAMRPATLLMIGLSLGTLLAAANFVQPAKAQRLDAAREQALRECNFREGRDPHDPYEGKKSGNRMFHYKACMADHGQIE
jgi:hypothetical protein